MRCQRRTDTSHGNPIIAQRELAQKQRAHRERLSQVKSTLDTCSPAAHPHLTLYGRDFVAKKKQAAEDSFNDFKMIQSIARTMSRKPVEAERKGPSSLNACTQKREINRIMYENQKILRGIEHAEPSLKVKDVLRAHEQNIRYAINASHTMRRSGELDEEIARFRQQDRRMARGQAARSRRADSTSTRRFRRCNGSQSLPCLRDDVSSATTFSTPCAVAPLHDSAPCAASAVGGSDGLCGSSNGHHFGYSSSGRVSQEIQLIVRDLQPNNSEPAAGSSVSSSSNRKKPDDLLCAEDMVLVAQSPIEHSFARPVQLPFHGARARPQSAPAGSRKTALKEHECVLTQQPGCG